MSGRKVIKTLIFIENVFGIHRNYSLLSKRLKCLAICRVVIEIVFLLTFFLHNIELAISFSRMMVPTDVTFLVVFLYFIISLTINNLTVIIFSYFYSKHFKVLVSSIEAIQKLCQKDMLFKRKMAAETRRFYIDLSVISAMLIAWFSFSLYDSWDWLVTNALEFTNFISARILECRILIGSIVFYELSEILVARLNYLNASISKVVKKINDATQENDGGRELQRMAEDMERWGEVSKLLVTACDQLRDCLGAQITLSLYCISVVYIVLLYSFINYFINETFLWRSSVWSFTLTMGLYLTVKILILASGQRAWREADALDTNLARLWRDLLAIPGPDAQRCAHSARALQRRVRTTPARVRLQAGLPARMALLVDIAAAVLAHTIVLLQLNHVV